jgi:tRNA(Arg) A34 adenosine deaminase TadA
MCADTAPTRAEAMALALRLARAAMDAGEVPVGAVLVGPDGTTLAQDRNRIEELCDPTAHAEILALRAAAAKLGTPRLVGCDLYVTLEPCPMCAHAASLARVRRIYYGAEDPKGGGIDHGPRVLASSSCHHRPEVYGGIAASRAASLLRTFFTARR